MGLCVYLGISRRAPVLTLVLWVSMLAEVVIWPDIAGREHIVAMVAAVVITVPLRWRPADGYAVAIRRLVVGSGARAVTR